MNKPLFYTLLLGVHLAFGQIKTQNTLNLKDDPKERARVEEAKIVDPITGKVPFNELENARNLMTNIFPTMAQIPGIEWNERGPNNIGGRVRALMFDPNDPNNRKVWAGGIAGGLWYNLNVTSADSSWYKVSDFWDNMAVSCIAYDPSKPNIFYAGTGEGYGNGDAVYGGGIWKTTDGGLTWARLASTKPDYTATSGVGYAFTNIQKIVVNSSGRVFAATQAGVYSSSDGGTTWSVAAGLPSGGQVNGYPSSFVSDLEIATDNVVYAAYGWFHYPSYPIGNASKIYKTSGSHDGTAWTDITPAGLTGSRTEIALAPSTSGATQVVYMVNQLNNDGATINATKRSDNAGGAWTDITKPTGGSTSPDITNGQAWYDLILRVHPTNPAIVYAGGATHARTLNGTAGVVTWSAFDYWSGVHPDHHAFEFRPGSPNEVAAGNDGGIYYSSNWGDAAVTNIANVNFATRNKNFNVSQYYGAALKNISNDGYLLGGLQDNNSLKMPGTYNTIGAASVVLGGDGGLSFIDQDNPGYQFVTTQFNNYYLCDANGNLIKDLTPKYGGAFINPADYDSPNNILYSFEGFFNPPGTTDIARYVISGTNTHSYTYFSMAGNLDVTFIKVGLTANTVFVGTSNGFVYKLTGITGVDGMIPTRTTVLTPTQTGGVGGTISCIEIGATENELLITKSNYNVKSVFYSADGGTNWTSKDESTYGLPNIPVRYALFNPLNRQQVLLATELGVWTTNNITATNPEWSPTNAKMAHVRCDMLKFRTADNTVLVATHGRGLFTTKLNQTNPCQTVMTLVAPYDNKTSGTSVYGKTETISATNQVSGTANVTYKASKSIVLLPTNPTDGSAGFKADSGTVFHAYITGCEN